VRENNQSLTFTLTRTLTPSPFYLHHLSHFCLPLVNVRFNASTNAAPAGLEYLRLSLSRKLRFACIRLFTMQPLRGLGLFQATVLLTVIRDVTPVGLFEI